MSVRTCDLCGSRLSVSSAAVDGLLLCRSCAERYTALCRECGSRIWKTDNFGDSDTVLCRDCYDGLYTRCHRCGTLLRRATACYGASDHLREHPYCDPCFARLPLAGLIHPYSYKGVRFLIGMFENSFLSRQYCKGTVFAPANTSYYCFVVWIFLSFPAISSRL